MGLLLVLHAAEAQECLTCRTEECPSKEGVKDWCGKGKDPQAKGRPRQRQPKAEPAVVLVPPTSPPDANQEAPRQEPPPPEVVREPPAPPVYQVTPPPPPSQRSDERRLVLAPRPEVASGPPIYKRWWLWTGLGVVVAGATVAGVLAATKPWALPVPGEVIDLRGKL